MLARILATRVGNVLISSLKEFEEDFGFTIMIDGYYSWSENDVGCDKYPFYYYMIDLIDEENS